MNKFKVGDTALILRGPCQGKTGVVLRRDDGGVLVQFKGWREGHYGNGYSTNPDCWFYFSNMVRLFEEVLEENE